MNHWYWILSERPGEYVEQLKVNSKYRYLGLPHDRSLAGTVLHRKDRHEGIIGQRFPVTFQKVQGSSFHSGGMLPVDSIFIDPLAGPQGGSCRCGVGVGAALMKLAQHPLDMPHEKHQITDNPRELKNEHLIFCRYEGTEI